MKHKSFIIKSILLLILPLCSTAQYLEAGINGGGSNFLGDVGPYRIDVPRGYHAGLLFRYNFNRYWSLRFQGNYGMIAADDANSTLDERKERNLNFRSEIWEAYAAAEFNFFEFEPGTKLNHTPYINAGFGIFSFNPEANYNGDWIALRPLRTEGQGTSLGSGSPYATASSYFIFSLGYKWGLGRFSSIAIESSFRNTYTDYLDDVSGYYADPVVLSTEVSELSATLADRSLSQSNKENILRGDPTNRDWYIFTGITLQFKFGELYEKCANFIGK
tara:strand:- start:1280 stop:2104 length:825 start_codon:yes stop_codon:yes gene_type:complete